MPNSLRTKLSKLRYKRQISDEEYRELTEKLNGHDKELLDKIRADIGMYEADCILQGGTDECEKCNSNVFGSIYRIIDKYKTKSEVQDAIGN